MKLIQYLPVIIMGLLLQQVTYAAFNDTDDHENHTEKHAEPMAADDHQDEGSIDEHDDEQGDEHGDEHNEQSTKIKDAMAAQVNIKTAVAGSQSLAQTIVTYGSLTASPEQLSHVRARYTGLIKSVKPSIGDPIKKGDLLAEVESNESLNNYQITAPITGTIIQRHANTGEVTQDQVLFSIANFDSLWAEFRIYPAQHSKVQAEQSVAIIADNVELNSKIQHIIPALDKPYQLARVKFDNTTQKLSPGLLVEGHITVDKFTAAVAVMNNALQTMNGQTGVFIQQDEEYTFVPLQLGRRNDQYTEILAGLSAGQTYVTINSFLIKADIEKSAAKHEH